MLAAAGLLLAMSVPAAVPSGPGPQLQLYVSLEPGVALTAGEVRYIGAEVHRIWAPVLDVAVSPASGTRPAASETIRVVITNRLATENTHAGLGWIDFVDGEPQPEITISLAAARSLASRGTWHGMPFSMLPMRATQLFLQRALASALAHEVGHYVLHSTSHTSQGLMRAVFTVDDIMDRARSLERIDAESMANLRRRSLLARAPTTM